MPDLTMHILVKWLIFDARANYAHIGEMVDARPNYAHIGEMVDF